MTKTAQGHAACTEGSVTQALFRRANRSKQVVTAATTRGPQGATGAGARREPPHLFPQDAAQTSAGGGGLVSRPPCAGRASFLEISRFRGCGFTPLKSRGQNGMVRGGDNEGPSLRTPAEGWRKPLSGRCRVGRAGLTVVKGGGTHRVGDGRKMGGTRRTRN